MAIKQPKDSVQRRSLVSTLSQLGPSALIFGAVFLLLTGILTLLLSPDRFPVRLGDKVVRLSELRDEERLLREKQSTLFVRRDTLRVSDRAPVLHTLDTLRSGLTPVGPVLLAIEEAGRGFASASQDPILLSGLAYSSEDSQIHLSGSVHDQGGHSIQLLASFVDALRALPFIESVSEPEYVSTPATDGGSASPFSLTIRLVHA